MLDEATNFSCFLGFRFPRLAAYVDRMLELPVVKATRTDPQIQFKFFDGYKKKDVNIYDI